MAFSNYLEKKLVDHVFADVPYTAPATVYVALFNTLPAGDGSGGIEVSGGAYARQPISFAGGTGGSPTSTTNGALVQFPTATSDWGTINGAGIYDAATGGNLLEMGPLTMPKTVSSGDAFSFPANTYTISLN